MNSERQRILELVAEGTITVAQAEELLAALDDETRSASTTVLGAKEQPARARQAKSEGAGYVQALKELGVPVPSVDELIGLRSEGVTPEYVRSMRAAGVDNFSVDDLIALFSEGLTPEYVRSMREAGLEDLSPNNLIAMASSGLDADTLRAL